jgi:ribosome-associated heat shock protein Hsp15
MRNDRMGRRGREEEADEDVRLDKWLWAARFFKTRSMAQEAITGGKVYVDNLRAKPSRSVAVGQEILITTPRGRFTVIVEAVSGSRGSATIAATLYRETDESVRQREQVADMHRFAKMAAPSERPNAHDRKLLRRLKEGG